MEENKQLNEDKIIEARKLFDEKNFEGAIKILNEVIEKDPNIADTYFIRGSAYRHLKNYDEMAVNYTKALELEINFSTAYENQEKNCFDSEFIESEISIYANLINFGSYGDSDERYYFWRGGFYQVIGKYDAAIKDYTALLELNPNDADGYNRRGCLHKELKNYEEALKDFSKAIEIAPHYDFYYSRGEVYLELKKYKEATADFTKVIDDFSKNIRPQIKTTEVNLINRYLAKLYEFRGTCYKNLGQNAEAEKDFLRAKNLDLKIKIFDMEDFFRDKSMFQPGKFDDFQEFVAKQDDLEAVIKFLTKAIEEKPDDYVRYIYRGHVYHECGKTLEETEDFLTACDLRDNTKS